MTCKVMGVLNVTPDSFFDGGRYLDPSDAIRRGEEMLAEGADLIDVGGESTRPGATPVDEDEERRRVLPVVAALSKSVRVSIDTSKEAVANAAIEAGATLINDVSSSLSGVASRHGVGIVLMHMRGEPATMQRSPRYEDVVAEVSSYLEVAAARAESLGVEEIYVDPGIGFGKRLVEDNVALLKAIPRLVASGRLVVVGTSRKSFLGRLSAAPDGETLGPAERFEASLATATWSIVCGAAMVRVHDVKATVMAARLVGDRSAVDDEQLSPAGAHR